MRRKPKYLRSESLGLRDRWLISYTDVVTILLIVFVSVAAEGLKARVAEPPKPMPPAPVAPTPAPITPPTPIPAVPIPAVPMNDPRAGLLEIQRKLERPGLDLRLEPRGLVISLPQSVLFASGDDRVSAQALPALSQIASVMRDANNKIALVGYADITPIHNRRFTSNWALSAARSLNLLALLATQYGIPESRLSIQGYGSNVPLGSNDTEAGRAANRRVEILIMDD